MPKVPTFTPGSLDYSTLINQSAPLGSGLQTAAKGAIGFSKKLSQYYDIIQSRKDRLFLLSKQNQIHQQRTKELLDLREQFKERDAQYLVDSEAKRINEQRTDFLEGVRPKLQGQVTQIYNSANAQFLGRVASHEYSEFERWRKTELGLTVQAAQGEAMTIDVGDVKGLFRIVGRLRGQLSVAPIQSPDSAEIHTKDTILQTYAFWARTAPQIADQVLTENSAALQTIMGKDYNKLLTAFQTGKRIHEQERALNYKWAKRQEIETQEATMKNGVDLFIDPNKRLDTNWILSSKDNLSSTQMRILNNLIKTQDSAKPLNNSQVDWIEYYRLSNLVRTQKESGYDLDFVAEEIASQIERTITPELGKALLKTLSKGKELSPQQERAYKIINSTKFHKRNAMLNLAAKAMHTSQLDKWIKENPGEDPVKGYLKDTLFKEHEDDLLYMYNEAYIESKKPKSKNWFFSLFGGDDDEPSGYEDLFGEPKEFSETSDEHAYITKVILQLQRKYPERKVKDTPEVREELLRLYRIANPILENKGN